MKQTLFSVPLLFALLFCTAEGATAQNSEVYRAVYKVQGSYTPKKENDKSAYTEAVLEISSDKSFFFDRWFEIGDSVYQASLNENGDMIKATQAKTKSG